MWRSVSSNSGRLISIASDQKGQIEEFKSLLAGSEHSDGELAAAGEQAIRRLEQMLSESETCVGMLEDELDALRNETDAVISQAADNAIGQGDSRAEDAGLSAAELEQLQAQLDSMTDSIATLTTSNGDQIKVIQFAQNSAPVRTSTRWRASP